MSRKRPKKAKAKHHRVHKSKIDQRQTKLSRKENLIRVVRSTNTRVLIALFFSGLLGGYLLGKTISPIYDDSDLGQLAIREYVSRVSEVQSSRNGGLRPEDFTVIREATGQITVIKLRQPEFVYRCGVTDYWWSLQTIKPTLRASELREHSAAWRIPRRGIDYIDALTFAVGGLEAYQIRNTFPKYFSYLKHHKKGSFIKRTLAACLTFVAGVGTGVYLGYKNEPNCGDPCFRRLFENEEFWRGVTNSILERHSWYFKRDQNKNLLLDLDRGAGKFSLHEAGDINLIATAIYDIATGVEYERVARDRPEYNE